MNPLPEGLLRVNLRRLKMFFPVISQNLFKANLVIIRWTEHTAFGPCRPYTWTFVLAWLYLVTSNNITMDSIATCLQNTTKQQPTLVSAGVSIIQRQRRRCFF